MPRLDYVSQTAKSISVTFADMPADTDVVFVNTTSGVKTPSPSTALRYGGNAADISIDPNLAPGAYCLLAQTHGTGQFLAQTVVFYISNGSVDSEA
jgi:hypothetical protein